MFIPGIVALLNADSGVTAWLAGQPLYAASNPNQPPTYPYVVYWYFESASPPRTFDGKVSRKARIQFDFIGRLTDCLAGFQAFKSVLDGYKGTLTGGSRVITCDVGGGPTSPLPKDPSVVKMSQDFIFQYAE